MAKSKKQIAFDLDTNKLKEYYPTENWQNAYYDIKTFLKKNHFEHTQGSVYTSKNNITFANVINIIKKINLEFSWLNVCMKDCKVSNVPKQYSLNQYFNKDIKIPTREEAKQMKEVGSTHGQKKEVVEEKKGLSYVHSLGTISQKNSDNRKKTKGQER